MEGVPGKELASTRDIHGTESVSVGFLEGREKGMKSMGILGWGLGEGLKCSNCRLI